ncbi:MFS transporter [Ruminiclostridium cellulolyticum]|uniref:Major facilitator superfamily MFS_1 n=1 Tax=Ruminiclostridium cellulolyticum (strain ATCC 35319 / DSM 5812 / JCM 6584 / H10) TaxID=394503 RepID=B8I8L6_RUMCH|nr:MFS transporter [Ruminiclostridium cellulolyticum]ACL75249.1 major facilitator superfamily MFS_1 [Ruminiclostridium cellulolyticum H10]
MNTLQKIKTLGKHPLIQLLKNNKGNPTTLILMEPLWGIPYNLIAPFATLYMYTLGITDVQIGLILSIAMFVQVFFSFFGGIITDKLGRKFTTMMGDFFGWSIACLVWAISDNFWLFLIAVLFNSFEQINQTAWFCLLIEDADPKDLLGVYTWVNIGGLVAIFFAPISGLLINSFTVVPVVRVLYLVFALNMLIKVIITFRHCDETRQGKIRMAETKNTSVLQMLYEYRDLIPKVLKNIEIMKVVIISVILHITNLISTNFFSLYVTQRLGIADSYLAFFPILNAAVMLIFMIGIQHRLESVKFRIPMWIGLVLYAACSILLILTPIGSIPFVIIYVFVGAVASALVMPRKDALLQLNINPKERARINALIMSFTIAFASPFGYLAGWLSSIDRRLPFIFTFSIFIIAIIIVGRIRDPEFDEAHSEVDDPVVSGTVE